MRNTTISILFVCCFASASATVTDNDTAVVRLYLDMDFSNAGSSSIAIEQGVQTALSEVDNNLGDRRIEIVRKNHQGNSRRSLDNLRDFLADDKALAVFAGLHSPPLLANREFINRKGILVLDPWAAAAPITRYPSKTNWIFRLSLDDTKVGQFLVHHAVVERGLQRPALLLEHTGWGRSNEKTITQSLSEQGLRSYTVFWFNWGISQSAANIILRNVIQSGADSILLVANAPESKTFVRALLSLEANQRLPIISHWGLTGGDFSTEIGPVLRRQIDLSFVQTRFSFISHPEDAFGQQVLARAKARFPDSIRSADDIQAPTGFIHAYDMTRLLIAAVRRVGISGDIRKDRPRVRSALEQLDEPVKGLIKTYRRPFQSFDLAYPDAHEALTLKDLRMARYRDDNVIVLIKNSQE